MKSHICYPSLIACTIGGYLAREARANGVLSLFNDDRSWGIPVASIRDWEIVAVEKDEHDDEDIDD